MFAVAAAELAATGTANILIKRLGAGAWGPAGGCRLKDTTKINMQLQLVARSPKPLVASYV